MAVEMKTRGPPKVEKVILNHQLNIEGVRVGKSQGNPQLGGYSDMEEKPV